MIVEALRGHRPAVLSDLLGRFGLELQGVAWLILRDRALAEDVVVDTLLAALDHGHELRNPDALRPWLMRIATNRALAIRKGGGRVVQLHLVPEQAARSTDEDERLALLAGVERLPVRIRAAIALRYYADLPVRDVAAALGTSENTVKTQLREGLEKLRVALAELDPTDGRRPSMADELDPRLEARLRVALRADADALPFTLAVADLERRRVQRARARRTRALGLAAAFVIVAVGAGAVALSLGRLDGDVASSPSPSPAASSVGPDGLASFDVLGSLPGVAVEQLFDAEGVGDGIARPIGDAFGVMDLTVAVACDGGEIIVRLTTSDGTASDHPVACRPAGSVAHVAVTGAIERESLRGVAVRAPSGTRWRIVVGSGDPAPSTAGTCNPLPVGGRIAAAMLRDPIRNMDVLPGRIAWAGSDDPPDTLDTWGVEVLDEGGAAPRKTWEIVLTGACIASLDIQAADAADVRAAVGSGRTPRVDFVHLEPDGGRTARLPFQLLRTGDLLIRVAITVPVADGSTTTSVQVWHVLGDELVN